MGYFGHLVASRTAPGDAFPDAEPEPGDWVDGLAVWRVPERLGPDWEPYQVFAERLAGGLPGGFLVASVLDSDGALVQVGIPGRDVGWCWLHLDGVVSHFAQPWAPFDDEGERLTPEAEAAQDREWEAMAAAYADQLRSSALAGDAAADACRDWAVASGLEPGSTEVVRGVLESHHLLVEESFHELLVVLGAGAPADGAAVHVSREPGPEPYDD